jgi:hypothetical protein
LSLNGASRRLARIVVPVQSGWKERSGAPAIGGAFEPEHIDHQRGEFMRRFVVLIAAALLMISCSPEQDVTGSIHNKCATDLYGAFNPKAMDQCMAVCLKCDRGTTTTCSTSCTLKGAH